MGYKLNADAYILFTQIEVWVREFLIKIIRDNGVCQWAKTFLGKVHLESLKEIGKRIHEANEKQEMPEIEDIYISNINRELKIRKESVKGSVLLHPFYYLSWSDLDSLIRKTPNSDIISESIGKFNKVILVNNFRALNYLRNDVAHSRFISEADYKFFCLCWSSKE